MPERGSGRRDWREKAYPRAFCRRLRAYCARPSERDKRDKQLPSCLHAIEPVYRPPWLPADKGILIVSTESKCGALHSEVVKYSHIGVPSPGSYPALGDRPLLAAQRPPGKGREATHTGHRPFQITATHAGLFDHSTGLQQDFPGNRDAELLRGLGVDYQLELRRLLDRNVGRLRAFQYPVGHLRRAVDLIAEKRAVGHERAVIGKFAAASEHRQPPAGREFKNPLAPLRKRTA